MIFDEVLSGYDRDRYLVAYSSDIFQAQHNLVWNLRQFEQNRLKKVKLLHGSLQGLSSALEHLLLVADGLRQASKRPCWSTSKANIFSTFTPS
jgi:hypothetical protein